MNAYEMRYAMFQQASDVLHRHWQAAVDHECQKAHFEKRSPLSVQAPEFEEIKEYAKKMADFVSEK